MNDTELLKYQSHDLAISDAFAYRSRKLLNRIKEGVMTTEKEELCQKLHVALEQWNRLLENGTRFAVADASTEIRAICDRLDALDQKAA